MTKEKFLLHEEFSKPLNKNEFNEAKKKYMDLIKKHPYSIKETNGIFELIQSVKRNPEKIGPYKDISVFEALNRIGTDLVLLAGATNLFNSELTEITPKKIKLNMGTIRGFDFIVEITGNKYIYGEAFNAAESFCNEKMRQAIHKLTDNPENYTNSAIVFVNIEVKEKLNKYLGNNHKLLKKTSFKLMPIYCRTKDIFI